MKKIKGLLLFGILTLLGIGSSFGMFIDLRDNTGSQLLIPSYTHSTNSSFYNYSLGNFSYTSGTIVGLNNKGIYTFYLCRGSDSYINGITSYGYDPDNGNYSPLTFGSLNNCDWYNNPFSSFNGYFDYFYIRNDVSISPYSLRKDGPITRYLYFDDNNYYIYSGNVNDIPSGYTRQKLFLSVAGNYGSVSSNSSGNYLLTSLFDDSFSVSEPIIYSGYILLHFGGYDTDYYNGAGTLLLSLGDNVVYFNYYTGFYKDYSDISSNIPSLKGVLADGNSSSDGYTKFINFLNNGDKIVLTYGSISNGLSFYSYGYDYYSSSNLGGGYFTKTTNYFFNFQSDNSIPTFITPSGNGNQSSGSVAINTGLINLCLTSPSFYELNTIFCNRVFGGRDLSYYQGLIGSGAYLQSYIDGSGNLVYVIDIVDEPGVLTGGVVWECYGDRCINTESGSWGDVEPWEILHLSGGDILSSGYYLGFFESINETGYFFKCPYSYNNSRWVAGRSILNAIGRDPFLPINCFIAAYENGRRVKFFDEAFNGYSRGPLMSGDTQNHRNLFTFFDVLLSVALIFFLMKFYHLFK